MLQRAREGQVPENNMVEIDEKTPQRLVRTQRPFPTVSELQLWEDGVSTRPRRLDAVARPHESSGPLECTERRFAIVYVPHRKKWVQKRVKDRAKADRHYREYYLTEQEAFQVLATWLAFSKQRRLLRRRDGTNAPRVARR